MYICLCVLMRTDVCQGSHVAVLKVLHALGEHELVVHFAECCNNCASILESLGNREVVEAASKVLALLSSHLHAHAHVSKQWTCAQAISEGEQGTCCFEQNSLCTSTPSDSYEGELACMCVRRACLYVREESLLVCVWTGAYLSCGGKNLNSAVDSHQSILEFILNQ
jgi:hypothetical protein